MPPQASPAARLRALPDIATLGFTKPNTAGRQYRHGTMSGYNAGRCRCQFCKDAAAIYRAQRRLAGKDSPRRPRVVDTDGHISRDWFRLRIWKPALERAGLTFSVRATICDMRMRPGYSPEEPISRRSRRDSATAASPPPKSTCTPCPRPMTWHLTRSAESATGRKGGPRESPDSASGAAGIGAIAIAASVNALAHSYAGLYDWAVHHRLGGWQAMSWPAEIDVFLAVGELALYVAYLDGWPARQRLWPWATALTGPGGQRRRATSATSRPGPATRSSSPTG